MSRRLFLLVLLVGALFAFTGSVNAEAVTLELWNANANIQAQKWYSEVFKPAFEAANPGVRVNISFPTWAVFYDRFIAATAAGVPPDVVTANGPSYLEDGLLRPLDSYIAKWDKAGKFLGGALQLARFKNQTYGLPLSLAPRSLIYNKTLYFEAGLDGNNPNATWEGYKADVKKLTRWSDDRTTLTQAGTVMRLEDVGGFDGYIQQLGGSIINNDGTAAFNSPQGIEALEFWGDLFREFTPAGVKKPAFESGRLASDPYINSSVFEKVRQANPSLLSSIAVAPKPLTRERPVVILYGAPIGISAHSKHPDLAWKLLDYHFESEMLSGYNNAFGYIPPIKNVLRSDQLAASPWLRPFADLAYSYGMPVWAYSFSKSEARSSLTSALTEYTKGTISAKAALEDAGRRWNAMVTATPSGK